MISFDDDRAVALCEHGIAPRCSHVRFLKEFERCCYRRHQRRTVQSGPFGRSSNPASKAACVSRYPHQARKLHTFKATHVNCSLARVARARGVSAGGRAVARSAPLAEMMADTNATPPLGFEGRHDGQSKERNGKIVYGTIGLGQLKLNWIERASRSCSSATIRCSMRRRFTWSRTGGKLVIFPTL
jgi:hypothetical protein